MITLKKDGEAQHFQVKEVDGEYVLEAVDVWGDTAYEAYANAADVLRGVLPTNLPNGTPLYIIDWDLVSDNDRTKLQSQIHIYGADTHAWIPQTWSAI